MARLRSACRPNRMFSSVIALGSQTGRATHLDAITEQEQANLRAAETIITNGPSALTTASPNALRSYNHRSSRAEAVLSRAGTPDVAFQE